MAQPYIGEIRLFAGNFYPVGWAFCDGQLLQISENDALFTLIGTRYGGDGQSTFALPDLRGRTPIHFGSGLGLTPRTMGAAEGTESVTLTIQQIPVHTHPAVATTNPGNLASPAGGILAAPASAKPGVVTYGTAPPVAMSAQSITPTGGSQPHNNLQPYVCINYIISLFGIFPTVT